MFQNQNQKNFQMFSIHNCEPIAVINGRLMPSNNKHVDLVSQQSQHVHPITSQLQREVINLPAHNVIFN